MATASPSLLPLLFLARVSGLAVAVLVLFWALAFKSSFLAPSLSQQDLIYAVLHPVLMVIGFILLSGEAILVHRWLPGSRGLKKSVHLCLQGVALASGIFGIWTKFQGDDGIVANFYSLHSWMGLICVSLFGAQWLIGFLNFWHRGEVRTVRLRILPWHVFLGLYTYALAVATAETGLLEKLTFLQTRRNVSKHSTESMVVNSLGLGLALLSGFVILAAVSPKHQFLQSKLLYSDTSSVNARVDGDWRMLWNLKVPPCVKLFLWRSCRDCPPTRSKLQSSGVTCPAGCELCEGFFQVCIAMTVDERILFAMLMWMLWKRRNEVIWENKNYDAKSVVWRAKEILLDWNFAKSKSAIADNVTQQENSSWSKPSAGYLKCNIDASFQLGANRIGLAMCIRDEFGAFAMGCTSWMEANLRIREGEAASMDKFCCGYRTLRLTMLL